MGVSHASLAAWQALPVAGRDTRTRASWLATALAVAERHNLKPTQYEVHEALGRLFTTRPAIAAAALAHFPPLFTCSSAKCRRKRHATRCVHCRSSFELSAARREAEIGGASGRKSLTRRPTPSSMRSNISLTEANLQKTMLLDQLEPPKRTRTRLTGLANRRRLDRRLADEFALALRHNPPALGGDGGPRSLQDGERSLFACRGATAALRAIAKLLSAQVRPQPTSWRASAARSS